MSIAGLSPDAILKRIRFDHETRKGSVLDVIRLVTGCLQNHASQTFESIKTTFPHVNNSLVDFKFKGRGQRPTPVASLPTLLEVAWLCPGRQAKEFRRTGAVTLCRALGGDLTLVEEIQRRHDEVAGTSEQAALLAGTGVSVAEANKQALTIPLGPTTLDEDERRAKLRRFEIETAQQGLRAALDLADSLRRAAELESDKRHRLWLQDQSRNLVRLYMPGARNNGGALALPGPDGSSPGPSDPITLSDVAAELGFRNLSSAQLQALGKEAAALYREAHEGQAPPKHVQFVDGAARKVNSYTERDRGIVEQAVQKALG